MCSSQQQSQCQLINSQGFEESAFRSQSSDLQIPDLIIEKELLHNPDISQYYDPMIRSLDLYIDLGTSNTLIYGRGRGFLLNEPSVLALKHSARNAMILNSGREAKVMLGKTPEKITVERPLKEGVIANFDAASKMLWSFIHRIKKDHLLIRPRMIISLPCEVTEYEKAAVKNVGLSLGARTVHLLEEPVAAAIGAGLPVLGPVGQMIIDIGGGTTEIAVISMGCIVASNAIRVGGHTIDDLIIEHLQNEFRFAIGLQTAEKIKLEIAQAVIFQSRKTFIGGLDLTSGLPKRFEVTSEMIAPAIQNVTQKILDGAMKILEQIPPELSSDILSAGITLAGGGALLKNLDLLLTQKLGVPVHIARDPLFSVGLGGAKAIEDNKFFDALDCPA